MVEKRADIQHRIEDVAAVPHEKCTRAVDSAARSTAPHEPLRTPVQEDENVPELCRSLDLLQGGLHIRSETEFLVVSQQARQGLTAQRFWRLRILEISSMSSAISCSLERQPRQQQSNSYFQTNCLPRMAVLAGPNV